MKKLIDYKLKHQLLIYSFFPLLLILILQLLYTAYMAEQTEQITKQYFKSKVEALSISFEAEISNIEKAGETLAFNSSLSDLIKYDIGNEKLNQYQTMKYIDEIVTSIKKFNPTINNIFLAKDKHTFQSIFNGFTSGDQIQTMINISDLYSAIDPFETEKPFFSFYKSKQNQDMFLYIQPVFYGDSRLSGYSRSPYFLIFVCDITKLASFTPDSDKDVIYTIRDSHNNYFMYGANIIINASQYNELAQKYVRSVSYYIPNTNFYINCFINTKISDQKYNTISFFFTISVVFISICMIIVSIMWNRNIISPIKHIASQIANGTLNRKKYLFHGPANEIGVISDRLNEMIKSNKDMTSQIFKTQSQLYETEIIRQRSHFSALQSQINPHFLYNTLASIKGLAHMNNVDCIGDLCQAVSDILRYSIKGNDIVTLNDELNIIKQYIFIMSARFEGRFKVEYSIPDNLLDFQILKMTLQPLIENCIYHGFENVDSDGIIKISARLEYNSIILSVYDNGCGIQAETMEKLCVEMQDSQNLFTSSNASGIGIINIDKRIKLFTGHNYGITLYNGTPGTVVEIKFPQQIENPGRVELTAE